MKNAISLLPCFLIFSLTTLVSTPVQGQSLKQLIQAGVLPKTPSKPLELQPLLNRVPQGELEISVFLTKWKAGTRTPFISMILVA